MPARPRRYRKKPLAAFEHGTRLYAPTSGERRYRVVATDAAGGRLFHKFASEDDARAKARELEAYLADATPIRSTAERPRTVAALAEGYLAHLGGRSLRYRERQETLLRRWVLPRLGEFAVSAWTPAMSEAVLTAARCQLAAATVQTLGSCLRSLVTFAHKARWLPRDVDPMWGVGYSARAEHQGQAVGFIPRGNLPNDAQCAAVFEALAALGQPTWALAMRLKHRCGARWGELVALRAVDIGFEPHRVVYIHRAVEQSGHARRIKTTKNTQKRTSIFPTSLAAELAERVERVRHDHGEEGLLFPGCDGQPAERRQFLRLWHRAAAHAGMPMHTPTRALWHPHDLRHVAACWMLFDLGLDAAHVARLLGHANAAFTLSRYVGVRTGADSTTNEITAGW